MEGFLHSQTSSSSGAKENPSVSASPETTSVEHRDDRFSLPLFTSHHTRYRRCSGEVYKSAQAPIRRSVNPTESSTIISDPNFLELIRSSESSGQELVLCDDQSPASHTLRETKPTGFVSDTNTDRASYILINSLSMAWANNAVFRGLISDQWGPPVEATSNGLSSTFKEKFPEDQNALKPGQKINDQKMWEEGFDSTIFALSTRVELEIRKRHRPFCPYRLRGTQKTAQEYNTENLAHFRRKVAWNEICDSLDKRSANAPLSTEFEKVAADFFSGRAVEAEYDSDMVLLGTESKPYHLDFGKGDRTKVLEENPLADKTLALFLEDVVMANDMEKACAGKDTYHGLKVYRHDSHKVTLSKLREAPKQSDIIKVINLVTGRTQKDQDLPRLDKSLKVTGAIPGAVSDLKDVVSATKADLSTRVQNNSSGSVVGAQNTHATQAFVDLDDSVATAHTVQSTDYSNTPGDLSTLKSVLAGQMSTVEGASTVFSDISMEIPGSPAAAEKVGVDGTSASFSRPILLSREMTEKGGSSNPRPNGKLMKSSVESEEPYNSDADLRPALDADEIEVDVKTTHLKPSFGSGSSQKKKKGSRRKTVHKGKGGRKNAVVSSSNQGTQHSNHAVASLYQPSETSPKLNSEAQPGAHPNAVERKFTGNDAEIVMIAKDDNGWNEVKTKVSHKSKSPRKSASHRRTEIGHVDPFPNQDQAIYSGKFKPEEYPAISSKPLIFEPADGPANSLPPIIANATTISTGDNLSWEENLQNLPAEEAEALRVLSREAQHSIDLPGPQDAENGHASMTDTNDLHFPGDDSVVAMEKGLGEEANARTELHGTGLEWAAAELACPTKFSSQWRHSSLPYRSTTPSEDEFDESIEISTTRRRSNSTTLLDPRVRAVQFGDFPVLLDESIEGGSAAPSSHLSNPSHDIFNEASNSYEPVINANTAPVLPGNLSASAGLPMLMGKAHHASPMFMPQPYSPQGCFATGSIYHTVHQSLQDVPYGPPVPGFAQEPSSMLSPNSGHIIIHPHPISVTYEYPPNANTSPKIPSYDHQQDGQASQQGSDGEESATSSSPSDKSFEAHSIADQHTAQSNSPRGSPGHAGYRCSCCFRGAIPNAHKPLYFCPGCGPMCAIRYCSIACLLAHSYQHSTSCMRYPYYHRFDPHNMPPEEYEWERNYIAPIDPDTPERYRQRAFSMYCYRGPFPRVLRAWAVQNELPVGLIGCDIDESFKQVGDYHIFRSAISAAGKKLSPVEIICTLRLRHGDPMKEALNRALNACFLVCESRVVYFVFRLLRHLILDLDTWLFMTPILDQRTIYAEFIHQFSLEFNFNAEAHAEENVAFCLTQEWQRIRPVLEGLEMHHQILQYWFRSVSDDIRTP